MEEFPAFNSDNLPEHYLPGILQIHSLHLHQKGTLAKKLSCMTCKPNTLCAECLQSDPSNYSHDSEDEELQEEPPIQD